MKRSREAGRETVVLEALRRYPRNLLIGVGAHIADSAAVLPAAACLVSLVAFVAAPETKDIDIADAGAR